MTGMRNGVRGMQRLEPVIRDYPWGSRTALARLAGRPTPAPGPEAELWVGAHEGSPGYLPDAGCTLDEFIANDPAAALGGIASRFGGRLPFLLKVLAADKALSVQAHPGAQRAACAPDGVYVDRWAKPEAWVALEECEAFIGSLPFNAAAARLRSLGVQRLDALVQDAAAQPEPAHALLSGILRVPAAQHRALVSETVAAVTRLAGATEGDAQNLWNCVLRVHGQFPGDIGVVVLLTMVHRIVPPGWSCFLSAGLLHTFVRGAAVEVLANSDNVVRAGLTGKPIDVEELLAIVDVRTESALHEPQIPGMPCVYPSRTEYFTLHELTGMTKPLELPGLGSPRLALALQAPVTLRSARTDITLQPTQAAWIPAEESSVQVSGLPTARLFVVEPGVRSADI